MLEIDKKKRIIVLIDYFSRFIWAKLVSSKKSHNIQKFLKEVYDEQPFQTMICDNGKEFRNELVEQFCKSLKITPQYSIPHYHPSNGRVERANRTLRAAIIKSRGSLKSTLPKIIKNYNSIEHRGIGCAPKDAIKTKNIERIQQHDKKYRKE